MISSKPINKNHQMYSELLSRMHMMKGEKGDKGEDGKTPVKGIDYFTEEEITNILSYIQSNVKNGKDGESIRGKDGRDGKDGKTPFRLVDYWTKDDQEKIIKDVLKQVKQGKDGISPKIEDIVTKVTKELKLPDTKELVFKGELVDFLRRGGFHGGGISSVSHDGTLSGDGTLGNPLKVLGTSTFYSETPTGTINGVNKIFTVIHPINFIFTLAMNGQFIHPVDYSVLGSTITFINAPDISYSGLPFTINYS